MSDLKRMSAGERAAYLANVLSIAKVDAGSSGMEASVVEDVVDRLGASQSDLREAKRLLQTGSYRLRVMRSAAHRMANIEDMILIALADEKLVEAETKPIEQLSEVFKMSQADMNMAVKRSESRLRKLKQRGTSGRSSGMPFDSPGPGHPPPVPQQETSSAPPPVPRQKRPSPPPVPRRKKPEPLPSPELTKKPEPLRKPEPVRRPDSAPRRPVVPVEEEAAPEPVEEVPEPVAARPAADWKMCAQIRKATGHPREYCFGGGGKCLNPWGCRLIGMDWEAGADWFTLGDFRNDETFVFDKDAIRDRLVTALGVSAECPFLNPDYIELALAKIPSKATTMGRWKPRVCPTDAPNARSVLVRKYLHGCSMRAHVTADGVSPVGDREVVKVIKRASRQSGMEELDYVALTGE